MDAWWNGGNATVDELSSATSQVERRLAFRGASSPAATSLQNRTHAVSLSSIDSRTPEVGGAAKFMGWIEARASELNPDGSLQIMYGIDGRHELTEESLDHLEGYNGP